MITYENTKTIYDLVEHAGKEHGDKVFLRYEENDVIYDVTYRQFVEECHAIAAWTKEQDARIGHKVQVGLMGSSSHHYLAVMFGVMSNGNTVVPLDVQLDLEHFTDNLNRSDVDILFYDWEHHPLVEGAKEHCPKVQSYISLQHGKHVPCSDNILKEFAGRTVTPIISENDCAMILFTSGTTGRGKGVMLSNRNLIDNTFCNIDHNHPENQIYLNILPIHHVFCINGDVLVSMRYGCLLCLNRDMSKLAQHLQLFEPTIFRAVPMVAKALYNRFAILSKQNPEKSMEEIKKEVYGGRLKRIVSGGGYLAPDLAENYRRLGIEIGQGYGMSECSPVISAPDWTRPDKVASVGKIVLRCQVRIVDGEIQVKSPSVMMGYYKDPKNTAEAITEDGWLRTGDIGYVDDENFLYLTGRKKNLIILSNGENVAPEQIENMFEDERIVEDILVFEENDVITAEIYPNFQYAEAANITDIPSTISACVEKINQKLPSFKRILNFRIRENPFEKTSSKKIIRPKYFIQRQTEKEEISHLILPENELQQKIYDCISEILGHQHFGIDTELYKAGLDSFGSIMLLTELAQRLNLSLTLDDLMSHPTVLKLEAFYNETQNMQSVDYSIRPVYPLTNLQIYFAYVMRGNTTANLPSLIRLDDSVDLQKLKESVEKLFDIHPGLKSIIQMDEGTYKSFRDDNRKVQIPIKTLSDAQWEETKKHLLVPYMYEKGEPLYHAGIYKTDSANYLFFDIGHIVGDGMTLKILFEDLNDLYAGKPVEKEQYTLFEYVLDEKDREKKGKRTQDILYFQNLMKNFKIRKSILTRSDCYDLNHGINASLRGRFFHLSPNKMAAFCKKNSVSDNVMFLTAYNYCIGIFSNEKDTICTSIHSGRTDGRWNRLAGPLFLTYLFRYTNVAHETVPQLLAKSGRQIMDTMRCHISTLHADEMFFQYQGDLLELDEIGGAPAKRERIQLDSLPFHLQVMKDMRGYYYELRYWENRFDRQQLEIFMNCLEIILEAMLEEPSVRRLKKHLPDTLFPKHYFIKAGSVNKAAGFTLIHDLSDDIKVKAYVFDETCRKQPFGAWGSLYIMDHPTKNWTDKITNPYGPGMLYQTGLTARILPDGNLDILESCGRTVLMENLTGRDFIDLHKIEEILCSRDDIEQASAYVRWGEEHRLVLCADITGKQEPDLEELKAWMAERCEKASIPAEIHFTESIGK